MPQPTISLEPINDQPLTLRPETDTQQAEKRRVVVFFWQGARLAGRGLSGAITVLAVAPLLPLAGLMHLIAMLERNTSSPTTGSA